jgi:hypothetical protein
MGPKCLQNGEAGGKTASSGTYHTPYEPGATLLTSVKNSATMCAR